MKRFLCSRTILTFRRMMFRKQTYFGPLGFWILRFVLLGIIGFCCVNVVFMLLIFLDDKSSNDDLSASDGLIHRKLEDIVFNQVHGQAELFGEVQKKIARTKFLFLSYAQRSTLMEHLLLEDRLFVLDVNKKIRDHNPDLDMYWGKITRTNIVTALSLIRNVFDCHTDDDSLLMSAEEREACQNHVYRAVHVSYMSMQDLEPILNNYRSEIKVIILHQDPRSVYYNEKIEEDVRRFSARMCIQMMRDMERMNEFSAYIRLNIYDLYPFRSFYNSF